MPAKEPDLDEDVLLKAPPPKATGGRKKALPKESQGHLVKAPPNDAAKGGPKGTPKGSPRAPTQIVARHSRAGEALGVALLALALLAVTALVSLQFGSGRLMGPFGRMLALSLYALLGLGAYLVVLAVGFIGLRTLMGRGQTIRWTVWAGYLGATLAGAVLFHCLFPRYVVHGFTAGGKGGEILGEVLVALFSTAGTYLVTWVAMVLCLMVATEASLVQVAVGGGRAFPRIGQAVAGGRGHLT